MILNCRVDETMTFISPYLENGFLYLSNSILCKKCDKSELKLLCLSNLIDTESSYMPTKNPKGSLLDSFRPQNYVLCIKHLYLEFLLPTHVVQPNRHKAEFCKEYSFWIRIGAKKMDRTFLFKSFFKYVILFEEYNNVKDKGLKII